MNILVVSDTHRSVNPLRQLLAIFKSKAEAVVHLGDHSDDLLRYRKEFPTLEMYAVNGNCDYGLSGEQERLLHVGRRKILLTHGHRQNVKMGLDRLRYYAEEREADACLFGHTHTSAIFEAGPVFFMNPGSLGQPRPGDKPSYGLLSISDTGVIKGVVLPFTDTGA